MAGPGCQALAAMLTRNSTLRHLSVLWAGADHSALTAIATALASNSTLSSLCLGDPRSLTPAQVTQAAASILANATAHLRRLDFSYITLPSPAHAATFCAALHKNSGLVELCLPYLAINYARSQPEVVGGASADLPDDLVPEGATKDAGRWVLEAATEAEAAALLGRTLQSRGVHLQSLELPFMHVRGSGAAAHSALAAAAVQHATELTRLDLLQVPLLQQLPCS